VLPLPEPLPELVLEPLEEPLLEEPLLAVLPELPPLPLDPLVEEPEPLVEPPPELLLEPPLDPLEVLPAPLLLPLPFPDWLASMSPPVPVSPTAASPPAPELDDPPASLLCPTGPNRLDAGVPLQAGATSRIPRRGKMPIRMVDRLHVPPRPVEAPASRSRNAIRRRECVSAQRSCREKRASHANWKMGAPPLTDTYCVRAQRKPRSDQP
jgi:hypothetical protein